MPRVEIPQLGTPMMDVREMFREAIGQKQFEIVIHTTVPLGSMREVTKLSVIVHNGAEDPVVFTEEAMIDDAIRLLLAKIDPCPHCGGAGKIDQRTQAMIEADTPAEYVPCKACRGWGRRRERK